MQRAKKKSFDDVSKHRNKLKIQLQIVTHIAVLLFFLNSITNVLNYWGVLRVNCAFVIYTLHYTYLIAKCFLYGAFIIRLRLTYEHSTFEFSSKPYTLLFIFVAIFFLITIFASPFLISGNLSYNPGILCV